MTFFPSACIWNFKEPVADTLLKIKQTAFHYVDVTPETLASPEAKQKLKELGLKVSCVALSSALPKGSSLEGDADRLRKATAYVRQALEQSRELGAKAAYLTACSDSRRLEAFRTVVRTLAEDAGSKGVRLCIEPAPGKALPGAKETLAFLDEAGHPNLYLLLDTGHSLLSKEKPWEAIREAGVRLGYVQMNDNDGKKDRHWALLDGRLKEEDLVQTLDALKETGYEGTLGLELSGRLPSLISSLAKNRNLLMRLQAPVEPKSLQEPEARRKH